MKVTIKTSHEFSIQDLTDIMVTALEGGINYWCSRATIKLNPDGTYWNIAESDQACIKYASDAVPYDGRLILFDAESEEEWELTLKKVMSGIQKYCEETNTNPAELMDDYDADTADQIIQYALFNEIVFG